MPKKPASPERSKKITAGATALAALPAHIRQELQARRAHHIEDWARRLLLNMDGQVRRLTEEEVRELAWGPTPIP